MLIIVVLAEDTPLTETTNSFVPVAVLTELTDVVVEITPLTSEVKTFPEDETVFPVIIELVAITPLIFEVKTFPLADWANELIMFATPDEIPFTITSKKFADEDAMFEVIIDEVEVTPFTLLVRMFAAAESEF